MKRLLLILLFISSISIAVDLDENGDINFQLLGEAETDILNFPNYQKFFLLGNKAFKAGNMEDAIYNFQEASLCNPRSPQPYFNLALCLEDQDDKQGAIEAYRKAVEMKPEYSKAHHQLGNLLQATEKVDEAITHYRAAIKHNPKLTDLALQTARLLVDHEKFSDSIEYYERALTAKADDIVVRFEYANSLNTTNHTQQALEQYLQLLKKRPNDSSILYNTAYTLKKLGRIDEAMPYYDATLKRRPDHAEAHFSLGLAHMITGDWEKGWPEYEWRWQRGTQLSPRDLKQPRWDGTPLNGKKILLHAEQGLGDTFQFVRYAKIIKEQYGGHVIFGVQSPLHVFAIRCLPYVDKVIPLSHIFTEECDVQAPLLSIPLILKTTKETAPTPIPYIEPEAALVELWGRRLQADRNFKVGICWQGNSKYSSPFLRSVVAAKSIPLKKFKPILDVPGVSFYSLQKQTGEDQLKELADLNIKTFDAEFDDKHGRFMDTAAVIKHLDLVITIDTSISHLTGALGKPVWVMIPQPPDWRWMLKGTDTPWYPNNMRLFRQPTQGDWDSVLYTIAQELRAVVMKRKPIMETKQIKRSYVTQKVEEPLMQSSTPSSFSARTQLESELASINKKLSLLSKAIQTTDASPDNELFMKSMRNFYMLSELRNQLKDKIAALEGI